MAFKSIVIGVLLVLLGTSVYGGLILAGDPSPSLTSLIPAAIGMMIVALGFVARSEKLRMHAMHGVATLSLLGLLAPAGRLAMQFARGTLPPALALCSLLLMALLCAVLLLLCIQSFVAARRRQSG